MKEKKPDIVLSKCICELCEETYTKYPHWLKSMPSSDEMLRHRECGYNSITLQAAEYKGRLWLAGYVEDRRYQAYAAGYYPRYCPECGRKLEN